MNRGLSEITTNLLASAIWLGLCWLLLVLL